MDADTKYPSGDPTKPEYEPKNYDGKFRGPLLLRYALGNSINTIAVKTTALVGVKNILKLGYDMGLSTWQPTDDMLKRVGLSLPLGGAEVHMIDEAVAYSTLANGGQRTDSVAILKVTDPKGNTLYQYQPTPPRPVLDPGIAYIISSILSDNDARKDEFGPNSYLVIPGRTVAAKTGTTDDKRDNWTSGYTKDRVVVTWVGNNDNTPMNQALASGITGAAPIWNRIMKAAIKDLPDAPFDQPSNVIQMDIDGYGGGLPVDGQPKRKEYFIKGTEPTGPGAIYQKLKISHHDSTKLANAVEVANGDYDEKQFIVFKEDDPVSGDGKNRWQDGINAWINSQSDNAKYKPPTDTYNGTNQIVINIKSPSDQSEVNDNNVTVTGQVISTADVNTVEVTLGGTTKSSNGKDFSQTFNVSNGQYDIHVHATDARGTTSDRDIHIGVNQPFATPSPSPTPTP
jgi:membrane peptidoglycan carboxypeptidase